MVLAYCTRVERRDGQILRFTSWRDTLRGVTFNGLTENYDPMDGVDAAAHQASEGIELQDSGVQGVISDSRITEEDLFNGFYLGAIIDQFRVDPLDLVAGPLTPVRWTIGNIDHDFETWRADLRSIITAIDFSSGRIIGKQCDDVFGGPRCTRDLGDVTYEPVVVASTTDQYREFDAVLATIPGGLGDDYFRIGRVEWLEGDNVDTVSPVRAYVDASRRITLLHKTRNPILAGDRFRIVAGCQHNTVACNGYGNLDNFQGFPDVPGPDRILEKS